MEVGLNCFHSQTAHSAVPVAVEYPHSKSPLLCRLWDVNLVRLRHESACVSGEKVYSYGLRHLPIVLTASCLVVASSRMIFALFGCRPQRQTVNSRFWGRNQRKGSFVSRKDVTPFPIYKKVFVGSSAVIESEAGVEEREVASFNTSWKRTNLKFFCIAERQWFLGKVHTLDLSIHVRAPYVGNCQALLRESVLKYGNGSNWTAGGRTNHHSKQWWTKLPPIN